jgi:flavodoxin
MKIGIIVHSQTGNTYSVIQKLKEKLLRAGHSVNVERLETVGGEKTNVKDVTSIQLKTKPDISSYDRLIFAGPVQGASISPVLAAYLNQIASLQNKKVICLVTEFFPYPWMGGNRAISQMKNICESKGASIMGTGIVNWMGIQREKRIEEVVERLSRLF